MGRVQITMQDNEGNQRLVFTRDDHVNGIIAEEIGFNEKRPTPANSEEDVMTGFIMGTYGFTAAFQYAYLQMEERPNIVKVSIKKIGKVKVN